MAETQVERIMKHLNCSKEEALDIIACDKAIDRGERMEFDLPIELEKEAKKMSNVGSRKTDGKKVERKRKENPTKSTLITEISQFLTENGYENVQITNKERQIAFNVGENSFELTLVQKRAKK
jgi:hypothetical protein